MSAFSAIPDAGRHIFETVDLLYPYVIYHVDLEKLTRDSCLIGIAKRRDFSALLKSLSSSVFRRWFRLMLPALASLFIGFILSRAGISCALYSDWNTLTPTDPPATERTTINARLPYPEESTFSTLLKDILSITDPFAFGGIRFPMFNFPLWTIQVEFMGSMVVFMLVLGIAVARPVFQVAIPSMLVLFCLATGKWQWALFTSGVVLAELSQRRSLYPELPLDTDIEDAAEKEVPHSPSALHQRIALYLPGFSMFIVALYLGTYPEGDADSTPGYRFLSGYYPTSWGLYIGYFYPVIGAILLVSTLEHAKFLQRIFTTRIAQYLGDISLSLYMLHAFVVLTLADWLVVKSLSLTSFLGGYGFTVGMSSESTHHS
jgi:peptidoglycan/LPS O-acetylase OafA/YrhL